MRRSDPCSVLCRLKCAVFDLCPFIVSLVVAGCDLHTTKMDKNQLHKAKPNVAHTDLLSPLKMPL